jgi:Putative bacterial sensory transduction regulator
MTDFQSEESLASIERDIDGWLARSRDEHPVIEAVDRGEPGDNERRWYVRMRGDEKDVTTIWFTLGQRTLRYETYVMPAPAENAEQLYEHLLRRNEKLVGAHFSIGAEDAVFLRGELPLALLNEHELDRIVGTLYAYVERVFPTAIRIGFASRFSS